MDTLHIAEALARLASAICKEDNEAFIIIAVDTFKMEAILKTDLADDAASNILCGMIEQKSESMKEKVN